MEPCRRLVLQEAAPLGATQVEARLGGPERRDRQGNTIGLVKLRVLYARGSGIQARDATLACIVDARGRLVKAFVPHGGFPRLGGEGRR